MDKSQSTTITATAAGSFESSINGLRTGRRLQKITGGIQSFLNNQLSRLEVAIEQCAKAEQQDLVVQRIIVEFERQKQEWDLERQMEEERLFESGQKLVRGWEQLEQERQALQSETNVSATSSNS